MGLAEDITEIGRLIDAYDQQFPACHVFNDDWPPLEIRGERLSTPDWVACRVLPSALAFPDVVALEQELGIQFPPMFRAYLLARFHLFDQVHAHHHNHQISWPPIPSRDSFRAVREYIRGWQTLIAAGYIPFAEWGDGWGPMCFDTARREPDGECPVVWMDHELLHHIGPEACGNRANVEPLARPLYASSRELILDVFTVPPTHGTNQ